MGERTGNAVKAEIDPAPVRRAVLAADAMVVASHPSVSLAGARVLADGGNAIDATLAMAAMSWLALPGQCGVGGDAFAVVREPDGRVWTVCGSGYGPAGGTPEFFAEHGHRSIPMDGPLAVAVPGAIAALDALAASGASRELAVLWEPTAALAERGMPCTLKTRDDIAERVAALSGDPGTREVFLPDGRLPAVGQALPQRALAATIRTLAADPGGFYRGELAERAVAALRAAGAPFEGDEWAASGKVSAQAAISTSYAGYTVHQTPPPTPGWMVLQQAALCDGVLSGQPLLGVGAIDRMARAAALAFRDRWERCGSDTDRWQELLAPETIAARRAELDTGAVPVVGTPVRAGDTTSTVAVDAEGRAVSFIHSLAFTFGARVTIPGTGVVLNNRLARGAYLMPGHPSEVHPTRRPLHTLNAWIVTDADGRLRHVGNTPGGDGQVQWNMQLLSHLLDHGLDPQETVAAPRFTVFPGSDADVVHLPGELRCEDRIAPGVREGLQDLGHNVVTQGPWEAGGSALVISVDAERGCLTGGADPRQEGVVLGV